MTTETGRNIVETRVKESLGVEAAGTITPHEVGHQLFGTEQAAAHLFEDKQQLFQGIRLSLQPPAARRESGGPPSCPPTQKRSQTDIETALHYRADPGGEAFTAEDTQSLRGVNLGPAQPRGYRGGGDNRFILLSHALCGHAIPSLPHPPRGDPIWYTSADVVIHIENLIRAEHSMPGNNCGVRTG